MKKNSKVLVFLLGHRAGGVISCVYTLEHQSELAGLICESFVPNAGFSRDPKVVDALNTDPLIAHEVQPTHTVAEMVRADERLEREFSLITLPVLIIHGTADEVTKSSGSQTFYDTAGSTDKTLKLYDGHVHDLLNDIEKEVVIADIKNWIDARVRRTVQ